MGYFSWRCADDNKSMPNIASGLPSVPHFLLQPNGAAPIRCDIYEGYGEFGTTDAYQWLAEMNAKALNIDLTGYDDAERRNLGIFLAVGDVAMDPSNGKIYAFSLGARLPDLGFIVLDGNYATHQESLNGSVNELLDAGLLVSKKVSEVIEVRYPIKISKDPEAVYEELPASPIYEFQGFFYDDDPESFTEATGYDRW